jgi:tetratricopeptide (TPR) repeat protein
MRPLECRARRRWSAGRATLCGTLPAVALLVATLASPGWAQREEADVFVARAILAYDERRYDDALAALREALALAPDHLDALYYSGLVLTAQGRLEEAIAPLERARGLAADDHLVAYQLGTVYLGLQRYADAEPLLEQAFAREPSLAGLGYAVGYLRYRKGDHRGALAAFEQGRTDDPRIQQLTRLYAGLAAASLGLAERALAEIEAALRLVPASPLTSPAERLRDRVLAARRRPPDRRFRAEVRLGAFYDDNVRVVPEAAEDPVVRDLRRGRQDSFGEAGALRLDYSLIRTPRFDTTVTYSLFANYNNSLTDFNIVDHLVGVALTSGGTVRELPYQLRLQYAFDLLTLGGEEFVRRHTITPQATLVENATNLTSVHVQIQRKDFESSASLVPEERRSGTNWAAGLTHVFRFAGDRHLLKLGYQVDLDDTEGRNFRYLGHRLLAGAQYTLPWRDVQVRYDLDVHFRDYAHRNTVLPADAPGTVARSDTELTHVLGLSVPLPGRLTLAAEVQLTNNRSNLDAFQFDRTVFSVFLVWTY